MKEIDQTALIQQNKLNPYITAHKKKSDYEEIIPSKKKKLIVTIPNNSDQKYLLKTFNG